MFLLLTNQSRGQAFFSAHITLNLLGTALVLQLCRQGVVPLLWHSYFPNQVFMIGHGTTVAALLFRKSNNNVNTQQKLWRYWVLVRATATLTALLLGNVPLSALPGPNTFLVYAVCWCVVAFFPAWRQILEEVEILSVMMHVLSEVGCTETIINNTRHAYGVLDRMGLLGGPSHSWGWMTVIGWLWCWLVGTVSSCGGAIMTDLFSLAAPQWNFSPAHLLQSLSVVAGHSAVVSTLHILLVRWPLDNRQSGSPFQIRLLGMDESGTMVATYLGVNYIIGYMMKLSFEWWVKRPIIKDKKA